MNESPEQLKKHEQARYKIISWCFCKVISMVCVVSAILTAMLNDGSLPSLVMTAFLMLLAIYLKSGKKGMNICGHHHYINAAQRIM